MYIVHINTFLPFYYGTLTDIIKVNIIINTIVKRCQSQSIIGIPHKGVPELAISCLVILSQYIIGVNITTGAISHNISVTYINPSLELISFSSFRSSLRSIYRVLIPLLHPFNKTSSFFDSFLCELPFLKPLRQQYLLSSLVRLPLLSSFVMIVPFPFR